MPYRESHGRIAPRCRLSPELYHSTPLCGYTYDTVSRHRLSLLLVSLASYRGDTSLKTRYALRPIIIAIALCARRTARLINDAYDVNVIKNGRLITGNTHIKYGDTGRAERWSRTMDTYSTFNPREMELLQYITRSPSAFLLTNGSTLNVSKNFGDITNRYC